MNENIDLTKILKDCPIGWKLYSSIYGDVKFEAIKLQRLKYLYDSAIPQCELEEDIHPIKFTSQGIKYCVSSAGELIKGKGECTLFPSKDQRDWNKFSAPWYKKDRFNPNTLKPLDKVLVRDYPDNLWKVDFYSHRDINKTYQYICVGDFYKCCIPYNEETKHLIGTIEEAPEYYRYWGKNSTNNRRFDPKTLKLHDKVLVRDEHKYSWASAYFYHIKEDSDYPYMTTRSAYRYCIPYNDDTKRLIGTTDEAPEYYRYWED